MVVSEAEDAASRPEGGSWAKLLGLAKLGLGVAVVAYLFWCVQQNDSLGDLISQPKNWWVLSTALVLTVLAIIVSFVRWFLIARAADIDLSLAEAVRVGALGFALNFVGLGAVSGDLFKAVVVARGRPGKRAAAVTTIVLDRVTGLVTMLMVASVAFLALRGSGVTMSQDVLVACQTIVVITGVLVAALCLLFIRGVAGPWLADLLSRLPFVGPVLVDVVDAWAVYRSRMRWLLSAVLVCFLVDLLLIGSFYCVAIGLPFEAPSFIHHLVIVPLQLTAAAIVPVPNGMGAREAVVGVFYKGFGYDFGEGVLIAFGHTVAMLATGGLAMIYYLAKRASVSATLANEELAAE